MGRLLPAGFGGPVASDAGPRVIGIEGDEADALLAAMTASTARELLAAVHEEPAAPSELAEAVGTSLQNAQYHLGKLEAAGVVEVVDTVYSEKGREMKLYGPTDRPLVVVAGPEEQTATLRSAVSRLLAGLAVVAAASVLVQVLLGESLPLLPGGTGGGDAGGGVGAMTAQPAEHAAAATAGPPPGLVFFAGAAVVLVAVVGRWYWRRR